MRQQCTWNTPSHYESPELSNPSQKLVGLYSATKKSLTQLGNLLAELDEFLWSLPQSAVALYQKLRSRPKLFIPFLFFFVGAFSYCCWAEYCYLFLDEPLADAALRGDDEEVRNLLSRGADPNVQTEIGSAMESVSKESTRKLLIAAGGKPVHKRGD